MGSSEYAHVKVFMPKGRDDKKVLEDLLQHCETIELCGKGAVMLGLAADRADKIVQTLSTKFYNNKKLSMEIKENISVDPLQKRISLPKGHNYNLKLHFNAIKCVRITKNKKLPVWLYFLYFSTKEAAEEAMKKFVEVNGNKFYPLHCRLEKSVSSVCPKVEDEDNDDECEEEDEKEEWFG